MLLAAAALAAVRSVKQSFTFPLTLLFLSSHPTWVYLLPLLGAEGGECLAGKAAQVVQPTVSVCGLPAYMKVPEVMRLKMFS